MQDLLEIQEKIAIPSSEFAFHYARSGGPGGQNVNKVSSKVTLFWNPETSGVFSQFPDAIARLHQMYPSYFSKNGTLVLTSQLTRDQPRNRQDCLEKLQSMLQHALRKPKRRIPTRPTRGSVVRRLDDKARHAAKKSGRKFQMPD
ncbi:MAG: alternative ribosome rescue aminoacyl-tRNA hydrolase ArfB [Planctomycetia bacterium]|nr:alternative ribosome rescue aminoacyl-tRNA hydrolase ArfB [Planctomycetia bacterium]